MRSRFVDYYRAALSVLERALAVAVMLAVALAGIGSAQALSGMDWRASETLYEFIYRALLVVIGLELARMLVTHDLNAVLELLAFVIARKMLKPDLASEDIVLGVLGFVALLFARRFLPAGVPLSETKAISHES